MEDVEPVHVAPETVNPQNIAKIRDPILCTAPAVCSSFCNDKFREYDVLITSMLKRIAFLEKDYNFRVHMATDIGKPKPVNVGRQIK